ncbi:cobalamin biosynthesis protein [Caloramator sp. mosi_1]|uniref:cobalamin biosynthesis protein n=1 Tax=Caloramator sp. mosi_1 TaxID=3023090 RepID=UPI00235E08D1|nr:cobalamin biosynthesis protein [Caloramator sp. mosi_1]WDC85619.1 cobalamin biosynthesis protein [Caloramator sp. mosi_1]
MASFELKRDEEALLRLSRDLNVPIVFYNKDEINNVDCEMDEFVYKSVGVKAVSEPCARLLGGSLIVKKFKRME